MRITTNIACNHANRLQFMFKISSTYNSELAIRDLSNAKLKFYVELILNTNCRSLALKRRQK